MLRATLVAIFCAGIALVASDQSPHAKDLEKLLNNGTAETRFSDNIFEDASMDVPELIAKYRYPVEVHELTTSDGYILRMHRIPHGCHKNTDPNVKRPVVFLMHGLLSSSADWIMNGPGNSLGYELAEEGYDVWMGNARGNYYSRRHIQHNPDSLFRTTFWEFSWDEIGNIDVPAMIDYALAHTGQSRLHYVGHSQGTTAFWVMASLRPEYNDKIISMHALAPVAYMANNRSLLLRVIAAFGNDIEKLLSVMGVGEFLPNTQVMTWAGQNLCMDEIALQPVCSSIMFLFGGWNMDQHNTTMLPLILGHTPAGASVRQFVHYGQSINNLGFRRYDYGSARKNRRAYGKRKPPKYDLSKITTPVFLHYSDNDPLAHVNDVFRLHRELGKPVGLFRIPLGTWTHLDFVWGIDKRTYIIDRVVNLIKSMDVHGFENDLTYAIVD